MEIMWLFGGLITWGVAAGTDAFLRKNQVSTGEFQGRLKLRTILRNLALASLIALSIWGFATLQWYIPVAAYLVTLIISGFVVSPSRIEVLYLAQPSLFAASTLCAGYVWLVMYPFGQ